MIERRRVRTLRWREEEYLERVIGEQHRTGREHPPSLVCWLLELVQLELGSMGVTPRPWPYRRTYSPHEVMRP